MCNKSINTESATILIIDCVDFVRPKANAEIRTSLGQKHTMVQQHFEDTIPSFVKNFDFIITDSMHVLT